MRMCVVCLSSPTSIRCQASVIETETKKFEMIYSQGQIFGMNSVILLVNIEKIISLKKVWHKKQMLAHTNALVFIYFQYIIHTKHGFLLFGLKARQI